MKAMQSGVQRKVEHPLMHLEKRKGECRMVYKCVECGELFARRSIPHGLGFGYSFNTCLCQLVGKPGVIQMARRTP